MKGGVLVACLGLGLVVFGATVGERPPLARDPEPSPLPSIAAPLASEAVAVEAPTAPATATPKARASRPARAPTSTTSALPPASEAPASAAHEQGLRDRLAKLIGVRAALRAHDPERALTMLDELAREDSSSALVEEIMVLRIDVLREAGREAEAAALGRQFVERYPTSAYVTRVRTKSTGP